ncbi:MULTISPECIES: alpha/beta hydrolase family protein [Candidatus Ichthyocystis]|uniref:Putative exported protein n=1 Tax=Candidatus Ichthyocystis hellenicum TaxID=1561003 RepID=A0A0S4M4M6_9BURK|nr:MULTISPECIES: alpha/beta hydrolase [Ichthyocystis]CUT17229.1 putative exported protein [Candidatus Ichthyocystis hellenicum]
MRVRTIKVFFALTVLLGSCFVFAEESEDEAPDDTCVVLYVDPTTTEKVPVNHPVVLYYRSSKKNLCGQPRIIESRTGRIINAHVFKSSFFSNHQSMFLNSYKLLVDEDYFQPNEKYKIILGDSVVTEFKTAQKNSFQGNYLGQESVESIFSPWNDSSEDKVILARNINDPLGVLTRVLVKSKTPEVLATINKIMKKDLPVLGSLRGKYDVSLAKMNYVSADAFGREKNLSAFIAYPVAHGIEYSSLPAIIYLHGWNQPKHSPSAGQTADTWLATLAASQGFVFIAPDMLGYGSTSGTEPSYFMLDSNGEQVRDAWVAARSYFVDQLASGLTSNIILIGGRRGAYNAAATWINFAKHGEKISDIILYSGIYDVPYLISQESSELPYEKQLARNIIKTYSYYMGTTHSLNGASKEDLAYIYSLAELNSASSQANALDSQKSRVLMYERSPANNDFSVLLRSLLKNDSGLSIKKVPCYAPGLEKLVKLGILNISTVCSYRAWDSLLKG